MSTTTAATLHAARPMCASAMTRARSSTPVLAFAIATLLAACAAAPAPAPDAEAQVLALEREVCLAYLHGDVEAMRRDLTEDFTLVNGRGETSTRAEDLETARTGSIRYRRFENSGSRVRLYGADTAIVTGITSVAGTTASRHDFELRVRFTDTYVRQEGRWRLAASQASSALPAEGG